MIKQMKDIFIELDAAIKEENIGRKENGAPLIKTAEVRILGQYSLLLNASVAAVLDLIATLDLDAQIKADFFVTKTLKELIKKVNCTLDSDSPYIWLPSNAKFEQYLDLAHLKVYLLDPESALLSKAIKAPEKNKLLIKEALESGNFPNLKQKVIDEGGDIIFFK